MMGRTARAKLAALVVLFFMGTFAGQAQHLLDSLRGKVEQGTRITGEIRSTVSTIGRAVDGALDATDALRAQVADLQSKLAAGTATPAQVGELQTLVARLRAGPAGPRGAPGSPGPAGTSAAAPTTATTGPAPTATTATTSRPGQTTTTTRAATTTTTRRCDPLLALLGRC